MGCACAGDYALKIFHSPTSNGSAVHPTYPQDCRCRAWHGLAPFWESLKSHNLGTVEYLASSRDTLLLIAARQQVYAISPEDPDKFLRAFQHAFEMGSLQPISSTSVLPAAYVSQIWGDRIARYIVLGSFLLTLLLFAGAGLIIPGRESISLGFYPNGQPLPTVSSEQIILLPILGAFIFVIDLATGLYFYRHEETRLIAFLIWGFSVVTEGLFLAAIFQLSRVTG